MGRLNFHVLEIERYKKGINEKGTNMINHELFLKIASDHNSLTEEEIKLLHQASPSEVLNVCEALAEAKGFKIDPSGAWYEFAKSGVFENKNLNNEFNKVLYLQIEKTNKDAYLQLMMDDLDAQVETLESLFESPAQVAERLKSSTSENAEELYKRKVDATKLGFVLTNSLKKVLYKIIERYTPVTNENLSSSQEREWKEDTKISQVEELMAKVAVLGITIRDYDMNKAQVHTYLINEGEIMNAAKGPLRGQKDNLDLFQGVVDELQSLDYGQFDADVPPSAETHRILAEIEAINAVKFHQTNFKEKVARPLLKHLKNLKKEGKESEALLFIGYSSQFENLRDKFWMDYQEKSSLNGTSLSINDSEANAEAMSIAGAMDVSYSLEQYDELKDICEEIQSSSKIPSTFLDIYMANSSELHSMPSQQEVDELPEKYKKLIESRNEMGFFVTTPGITVIRQVVKPILEKREEQKRNMQRGVNMHRKNVANSYSM